MLGSSWGNSYMISLWEMISPTTIVGLLVSVTTMCPSILALNKIDTVFNYDLPSRSMFWRSPSLGLIFHSCINGSYTILHPDILPMFLPAL